MILTMNKHPLELNGKYLGMLREANDLLGNLDALNARLEEDGYLLIRGLHNRRKVQAARQLLLEKLDENGQLDKSYPLTQGVPAAGKRGRFPGGNKQVTHDQAFLDVVESPEIMDFCEMYFEAPVITYDFKWLRVIPPGGFTGAHYDIVYMGRGTKRVLTCWTPLDDVPFELGPLMLLVGSHRFEAIRRTYAEMDVDRDHVTESFSYDPIELVDRHGGRWGTSSFEMGDVLIFGMYTMHASLDNTTNRFRLSTDTRYQRADEPVDERWIGEDPIAHYAWTKGKTVPMEEMRQRWGV